MVFGGEAVRRKLSAKPIGFHLDVDLSSSLSAAQQQWRSTAAPDRWRDAYDVRDTTRYPSDQCRPHQADARKTLPPNHHPPPPMLHLLLQRRAKQSPPRSKNDITHTLSISLELNAV